LRDCAREVFINDFCFSTWAKCLFDKPSIPSPDYDPWKFNGKPGVSYTAKDQCEILLRDRDAYPFFNAQQSAICENLHCRTPNRSGFFFAGPALAGTDCGHGSWCDGGVCVRRTSTSKKPTMRTTTTTTTTTAPSTTTDSEQFSTWSSWSRQKCQSDCLKYSKGTQVITRTCTAGASCEGLSSSVELCDDRFICLKRTSVVEHGTQRCRDFSRRLNNVDTKGLGLQASYDPIRIWMPCAIFCKHTNSTSYITPRVELNKLGIDAYFPDGTWCNREGNVDFFCLKHHCLPEVSKLRYESYTR
jgi:thrombospondin motif-containing protein 18